MTELYCPACGEISDLETEIILQPGGTLKIECPVCGVEFEIPIMFYSPDEEEDDDDSDNRNA